VRFNANGDPVYKKILATLGENRFYSVKAVADGYVFCGGVSYTGASGESTTGAGTNEYNIGNGSCFFARKHNSDNKLVWQTFIGVDKGSAYLESIVKNNGGYLAVGNFTGALNSGESHGGTDVAVIRLNEAGEPENIRYFGSEGNDYAHEIIETGDAYIIAGDMTSEGTKDIFLVQVEKNDFMTSDIITLGKNGNSSILGLTALGPGEFAAVGYTSSGLGGEFKGMEDIFLSKWTWTGNIYVKSYTRNLGGTRVDRGLAAVYSGSKLAIAGYTESDDGHFAEYDHNGEKDAFIMEIDNDGNVSRVMGR
jgi:hypothetical protein